MAAVLAVLAPAAVAGGPKYVAGTTFFNPAVVGQPVHWANGQLRYWVDQSALNSNVSHAQAVAMVDAAAAVWSAVPTAGVTLTDAGTLNEDVSGGNAVASNKLFAAPADLTPASTGYPVGVVFDADGSVIDTLYGSGASDPLSCQFNGVWFWVDSFNPDATFAHAVIVLNGRCATTSDQLTMMSFQLERAFGRILGLDFSQVNPGAFSSGDANQTAGLPVMQPLSGACGPSGGNCIPNPTQLRPDDIAALNRLYPITAANLAQFPGKELTAENTVSIKGTLSFRNGVGMQGVNVVARPLDSGGNPLYAYTVTAVSGALFRGEHGSAVLGWADAGGTPFAEWGGTDASQQGAFDLSYMPLPAGMTTANYQITFETIDPLYIQKNAVGPYTDGSPAPSGTMPTLAVNSMAAGSAQTLDVAIADSAASSAQSAIASEESPRLLPPNGMWTGRLSQVSQTDWFLFPVRANRTFTVVTVALDEQGRAASTKAMPSVGVWDAFDAVGTAAVGTAPGFNGFATGETWLQVATGSDDVVRIGVADRRGDGRPDYAYMGWLLYADTVAPERVPLGGGPIAIYGTGFRPGDSVKVGGKAAVVTSISPNEITAIAPVGTAAGSVDVEVDEPASYNALALVSGGLSYDAGTGDSLHLVTAPANTVGIGVPLPFTVTAMDAALAPASGVTVTYTVTSGTATLGCGASTCTVTATGDGQATMNVAAVNSSIAVVTASLANGASLQAHFTGGAAPALSALTPFLSVAAGATVNWTVQALAVQSGAPAAGQTVTWQTATGVTMQGSASAATDTSGIATKTLTIGPLNEGVQTTVTACVNGTSNCAAFTILGARPEYATVEAVSGTAQTLGLTGTPAQMVLRLRDMNGNAMAGGTVVLHQAVYAWAPPCPPHGACAQAELLATSTATATSALDGTVSFAPATLSGSPTQTVGTATTGNAGVLAVTVEVHP